MKVVLPKRTIEAAYAWMKFAKLKSDEVEMLYQATQGMLTKIETITSGEEIGRGTSNSSSDGWWDSIKTHTHRESNSSFTSKSTTNCDHLEVDVSLAAKVCSWAKWDDKLASVEWNARLFKEIRKREDVRFSTFFNASEFSLIHDFLHRLRHNWREQDFGLTPVNHEVLIWYLGLMDDFSSFDFKNAINTSQECCFSVSHKYNAYRVTVTVRGGIYMICIMTLLLSHIGREAVIECYSLEECKRKLKEYSFEQLPVLFNTTVKTDIFQHNPIEWLDYYYEQKGGVV